MPKPKPKKAEDFGEQEGENEPVQGEIEDFEEEKFPPLANKKKLVGKVIVVESWRERAGENGPYLIFRGKIGKQEVAFSSGVVMKDQAEGRNGPFRAKLVLVEPEDGRPYYKFASPTG